MHSFANWVSKKEVIKKDNTKNELIIITESDDVNNPIYIGKLKTFKNYSNLEYFTNEINDTLKIDLFDWEMITIGSKETFLDTLIVNKNDTIDLKLKKGEISKSIRGKLKEKWNYSSILKENKVKRTIDSVYNIFYTPLSISPKIEPLIVKNDNFKLQLSFKSIKPNKTNAKLGSKLFPILIENYKELLNIYNKENIKNETDKNKVEFLNALLEKEVFTRIANLYSAFENKLLLDFLSSDVFLSEKNINKHNEYIYLNQLLNSYYIKKKKRKYLNATDLYKVYDSIPYCFKEDYVEKAKMVCLERITYEKHSLDSLVKYFNRFNNKYDNIVFKQYIEDKYLIDLKSFYNISHEVNFVDKNGKTGNLQSLIDSLKGKVIYVDYWASWCGPCRKVMPDSRKLQKIYRNKDISFVFFSIDKDRDKWILASKDEKINNHNYLVLNHNASKLKNKLKIDKIPRYLLYKKKGELINHNAPGPETKEIRTLLNTLLIE